MKPKPSTLKKSVRNKASRRDDLFELAGSRSQFDSSFLSLLDSSKEDLVRSVRELLKGREKERTEAALQLENEQFNVRLLVTCLRGLRYELLHIDAVRFGGLVKIIEKVLADCGWEPPPVK
jgi:hypothetical protein